jgi:hypothetical protein
MRVWPVLILQLNRLLAEKTMEVDFLAELGTQSLSPFPNLARRYKDGTTNSEIVPKNFVTTLANRIKRSATSRPRTPRV